jgi:hypothetical protein
VFLLAARRLRLSRSRNALLYWLAGGFAFAGGAGAVRTGLMGAQVDAGGMVIALASLPLWLLVRAMTARGAHAYGAERPVFTSIRRGAADGGLRRTAGGLTSAR